MRSERLIIQKKGYNGLKMSSEGLQWKGLEKNRPHSGEGRGLDLSGGEAGLGKESKGAVSGDTNSMFRSRTVI